MPDSSTSGQMLCRPQYLDDPTPTGRGCEHCGYDPLNGWHDGQIVEIEVECPKCHREIAVLSGFLSLARFEYEEPGKTRRWIDGYAWDIDIGRDGYDYRSRKVPGTGRSVKVDPWRDVFHGLRSRADYNEAETTKFELVCTDEDRCRFRRVVNLWRTSDAMVAAWRKGSHRIVAEIDL